MLNGKRILVTGGTGSFGKKFIETVFKKYPDVKRVVVYSRDELKQYEMAQQYPVDKYPQLRFFIGDVRDGERLKRACERIDIIVHAAALKHVPIAEYNPIECINTNINGAENIVNAALDCGVQNVVALSTDKACAPINLYGATKLCSDKLFIAANNMRGLRDLKFSVVRYGNVLGSRGSVVPFFMNKRKDGVLPITHEGMTRFNITLEEGVDMVLYAIENAWGGELFVPKIPSYRILDVAKAVAPDCKTELVGIRPGEKLHEEMITETDSMSTYDCGKYYVIAPAVPLWKMDDWSKKFNAKKVPEGFKYNSGENTDWIAPEEIRSLIKKHIDPNFTV
ncbi:UDP-N-acetylglucosamine 4,6-dehydratase (inverting) [Bacteriovorax stolpii]|uniref:UDP-N-acetylglucosamine 4,6-dehydratase (Inverting) n=1 Tax=Bacteriovorax stolpii TaxID=960 RepID=A0A2K9NMU2_BACTC|nr:UDP-N-acetylglucosamine 4,6-dehydratase (inverting) [Bacteriovorax stolpii]AUN96818.1 UDP-N-acetylglucosamine 4,6-dehydratase (inverting) [Bacteriovorax stolpii]TDP53096.1 UDP-N-acetylglucosamine 4,6-dehydratase (inverting) [Bacteriovorax stolpii]